MLEADASWALSYRLRRRRWRGVSSRWLFTKASALLRGLRRLGSWRAIRLANCAQRAASPSLSGTKIALTGRGLEECLEAAHLPKAVRCSSVSQGRSRSRLVLASIASVPPHGERRCWRSSPPGEHVPGGKAGDCPPAFRTRLSAERADARRHCRRRAADVPLRVSASLRAVLEATASSLAWPAYSRREEDAPAEFPPGDQAPGSEVEGRPPARHAGLQQSSRS